MVLGIERKVANTAKRAAFFSGGMALCTVGFGFLTVAGWLVLMPLVGAALTACIVAFTYFGIGLILLGLGSQSSDPVQHPEPKAEPAADLPAGPPIVQAFMHGLQAGAKAEQARH